MAVEEEDPACSCKDIDKTLFFKELFDSRINLIP
jgi:hypothetical protein